MAGHCLILGASGHFGRHAQNAFTNAGWQVSTFDRRGALSLPDAARGVDVIVNGWNPAYPDWAAQVPGLTAQVIDAAQASGAMVMVPGNVYVFGADMPPVLSPETPHRARNPLGRVRCEMEAAYHASGVKTVILRAGDFLDTGPTGNWFDRVITAKIGKNRFTYPGPLDRPHAWAFLPDLADRFVAVADRRETLPVFSDLAYEGLTLTGRELADLCQKALGRPLNVKRMSWLPLQMAQPVLPLARGLVEMRHLWERPHSLDGRALDVLVGPRPSHSPIAAIRRALEIEVDPDQAVV